MDLELQIKTRSKKNMELDYMKDIVIYDRSSSYITSNLSITPNTEKSNP